MATKQEAYDKVIKTIKSCKTYTQLLGARRMVYSYVKMYHKGQWDWLKKMVKTCEQREQQIELEQRYRGE